MTACGDARGHWFVVASADLNADGPAATVAGNRRDPPPACQGTGCVETVEGPSGSPPAFQATGAHESRPTVYVLSSLAARREELRTLVRAAGLDVRCFARPDECLRAARSDPLACVVADAEEQDTPVADVSRALAAQGSSTPVIVITEAGNLATAIAAMKEGAFDVIEQPYVAVRLVEVVRAALARQCARQQQETARGELRRRYAELTAREREVFHLVAAGFRSRAIAARLGIREKTVEVYRSRVNHKMNAHNAAELAQMLHRIEL